MAPIVSSRGLNRRAFVSRSLAAGGMAAAAHLLRPLDAWGAVSHRPLDPINPGSFVPCRPTRPSPPAKVLSTFECAERPNEYGPYEPPGSVGCSSSTM